MSATASRSTLLTTAFVNTDGRLAVVVMNTTEAPVRYSLLVGGQQLAMEIPARAIQTLAE